MPKIPNTEKQQPRAKDFFETTFQSESPCGVCSPLVGGFAANCVLQDVSKMIAMRTLTLITSSSGCLGGLVGCHGNNLAGP